MSCLKAFRWANKQLEERLRGANETIGVHKKNTDELERGLAEIRRMSERQDKIIKNVCDEATKWRARADAYLDALIDMRRQ